MGNMGGRCFWTLGQDPPPLVVGSPRCKRRCRFHAGKGRQLSATKVAVKKPKIIISSLDAERLDRLLESLPGNAFPGKNELEAELERAEVVEPHQIPPTVVTMNSKVRFRVESSDEEFSLTLVYPRDVAAGEGNISILAPVGSALLGLSQGDEIEWPKPGGGVLRVRIVEVLYQPERAGEFHR
jgi:regulator of nucleoside diphosphate kinase